MAFGSAHGFVFGLESVKDRVNRFQAPGLCVGEAASDRGVEIRQTRVTFLNEARVFPQDSVLRIIAAGRYQNRKLPRLAAKIRTHPHRWMLRAAYLSADQ